MLGLPRGRRGVNDDELCRAVVALLRKLRDWQHQEPNTLHSPAYDALVAEGKLHG